MTRRIIQNFAGRRALILAMPDTSTSILSATLIKLGLAVEIGDCRVEIEMQQLLPERDVLFVDGDLPLGPQAHPSASVPLIGLVGVEAPSRLKALTNLGATAFIRKPIHGGAVYTALFLGINQFMRHHDLVAQIEDHQAKRRRRRSVVKAIIGMMQDSGLDDDAAYDTLRRASMKARISLEDYCEAYLAARGGVGMLPASQSQA